MESQRECSVLNDIIIWNRAKINKKKKVKKTKQQQKKNTGCNTGRTESVNTTERSVVGDYSCIVWMYKVADLNDRGNVITKIKLLFYDGITA